MNTIYTIGYGNRKIKDFIDLLHQSNITILADVRSNPFSRFNPAYRRAAFEQHLKAAGIQYLFMGKELGGKPSDPNLYVNGVLSYEAVRSTIEYQSAIKSLVKRSESSLNICIMCSELDENNCHRKMLLASDLIAEGVQIIHIDKKGSATRNDAELKLL